MASVDDRVVNMVFNNAAFEQKIATTMGSLDKLNKSLSFPNASKGMQDVSAAAGGFNLSGMSTAIEGVSAKFLALSTIAVTALATVVSHVISAGAHLAKSLSLDQVIGGFKEYETNMNSIQTIMANTSADATTLDDVNAALQKLNLYSDQTIYNFSQMARNIGTFTAAGVDLDTSVGAIKGIANLAAVSGSNAEQASTAMYQLSQAMASGTVKLMDWNSVVNAGMGGEIFQKALFETGKSLGTISGVPIDQTFEQWTEAGNTFRGSLESGWITADVLTNTLQGFTGDMTEAQLLSMGYTQAQAAEVLRMGAVAKAAATEVKTFTQLVGTVKESIGSGWAQTFGLIIGNFDEAKSLFTGINSSIGDFVGKNADARNDILKTWHDFGARTALINGLGNVFRALGDIMKPIGQAFRTIFPPMTAERLIILTDRFRDWTQTLAPSSRLLWDLKQVFTGIFSAVKIGIGIIGDVVRAFGNLFQSMGKATGGGILDFFVKVGQYVTAFGEKVDAAGSVFALLADKLNLGYRAWFRVQQIVQAVLAVFEIAWTVIKELALAVASLFEGMGDSIDGSGIYKVLQFFGNLAEKVTTFKDNLIESGAIGNFFDKLVAMIQYPEFYIAKLKQKLRSFFLGDDLNDGISPAFDLFKDKIEEVKDKIVDFFNGTEVGDGLTKKVDEISQKVSDFFGMDALPDGAFKPLERLTDRWGGLKDTIAAIQTPPEWLTSLLEKTKEVLDDVWEGIKTWCSELGSKLAAAMKPGDFDAALDVLNVAFLGGIVAFLAKLTSGGIKFDIGDGFMKNISKSFDTLTGTLKVMQTEIKADILIKIAAAIGLLAVAILLLSLIDSEDLTKAMAAMAVGFTQLLGVMKLMDLIATGPMDAVKLGIMAGAMILMAGAMVILGLAMLIFASMSWEELAKGFAAIGVGLGLIAAGMHLMPGGVQMVLQSAALVLIGTALTILAGAVALFALMEWDTLKKGFAAVGAGLGIIAIAMHLMPGGVQMVLQSAGLVLVGIALSEIAGAVALFGTMDWETIGKGMVGIGGGLLIIAGAMQLMPISLPITAAGLVLVGIALSGIAAAMLIFGTMSWEEIGKGLVAMAGSLIILAAATNGMASAIIGAVAITLVSIALGLLIAVMKEIQKMSWGEIAKALLGIVAIMAAIGIAALALQSAIGPMLLLGAAMLILGAGFALFGLGAKLVVEAFMLIAEGGGSAVSTIILFIKELIKQLPAIVAAFAQGLIDLALTILKGLPVLLKALGVVIEHVLATIIKLAPKLAQTVVTLLTEMLGAIREMIPEVVKTGFAILTGLLTGIRDNIGEIVILVADIITNFLDALALKVPEIIDSVYNLLIAIIEGVVLKLAMLHLYLIPKGIELIQGLINGFQEKFPEISKFFTELPGKALELLGNLGTFLKEKGLDFVAGLLLGILEKAVDVVVFWQTLPFKVLGYIGSVIGTLVSKGIDFVAGLMSGITSKAAELTTWVKELPGKVVDWIGDVAKRLLQKGKDIIEGLWDGAKAIYENLKEWVMGIPGRILTNIGDWGEKLLQTGKDLIQGLWDGAKEIWNKATDWLSNLNPLSHFNDINLAKGHAIENLVPAGLAVMEGLLNGLIAGWGSTTNWLKTLDPSETVDPIIHNLQDSLSRIPEVLNGLEDFNPVITPVLDLTQVMGEAKKLGDILGPLPVLSLALSANQARAISVGTGASHDDSTSETAKGPTEISFVQNNHSPEALSTADIYRQTRNQIALAKEELAVL